MKITTDADKREITIKLSEQEANRVFKDIDAMPSMDYKTTIKFIKKMELATLTLDFIIPNNSGKSNMEE